MYSGITSGRVLNGELLYTEILEVNLFAFAYRLDIYDSHTFLTDNHVRLHSSQNASDTYDMHLRLTQNST